MQNIPRKGHSPERKIFYNDGIMNIIMDTDRIVSINDIEKFLQRVKKVKVVLNSKSDKYKFISKTLVRLKYKHL
jgi:hypothetical protein